jgi:hypothetical protein
MVRVVGADCTDRATRSRTPYGCSPKIAAALRCRRRRWCRTSEVKRPDTTRTLSPQPPGQQLLSHIYPRLCGVYAIAGVLPSSRARGVCATAAAARGGVPGASRRSVATESRRRRQVRPADPHTLQLAGGERQQGVLARVPVTVERVELGSASSNGSICAYEPDASGRGTGPRFAIQKAVSPRPSPRAYVFETAPAGRTDSGLRIEPRTLTVLLLLIYDLAPGSQSRRSHPLCGHRPRLGGTNAEFGSEFLHQTP